MTQPTFAESGSSIMDDDEELKAYREEQAREYGTYRATARIYAGNALAYDTGHPVPVSNVVRHGYWLNGQVELAEGAEHPPEVLAQIEAQAPPDRVPVEDTPAPAAVVDVPDEGERF